MGLVWRMIYGIYDGPSSTAVGLAMSTYIVDTKDALEASDLIMLYIY